jgi:plastocyanin
VWANVSGTPEERDYGGGVAELFLAAGEEKTAMILPPGYVYYEPAGAVSWDVSMTVTPPDWRVAVKQGDVLSISTTYDSRRASWYEQIPTDLDPGTYTYFCRIHPSMRGAFRVTG